MEENKVENVEKVETKKSNFVPSYARKKDDVENNTKNNGKKSKGKKTKKLKSKISLLLILIAIVLVITLLYFFVFKNSSVQESDYDTLMESYGLALMYDNGKVTPSEEVTKSEFIKMIIAATRDIDTIEDEVTNTNEIETTIDDEGNLVVNLNTDNKNESAEKEEVQYENIYWVEYAKDVDIITDNEINEENYNEVISYIEAIRLMSNVKIKILGKTLDTNVTPKFKDYSSYTNEQKWALSDLVYNNIIDDSENKIDGNKPLKKSQLNEILVRYVQKYNLLVEGEGKININPEKMPSNKDEYPYTLSSIDKSIYEIENYKDNESYKNSIECYSELRNKYKNFENIINTYYNTILNVNYEELNEEDFIEKINESTQYAFDEEKITQYINYVKENEIKISGNSKVQLPIIYFDGTFYRVRTKLEYNIESAKNLKNIFFNDTNSEYKLGKNEICIDVAIDKLISDEFYYMVINSIQDIESGKVKKIDIE